MTVNKHSIWKHSPKLQLESHCLLIHPCSHRCITFGGSKPGNHPLSFYAILKYLMKPIHECLENEPSVHRLAAGSLLPFFMLSWLLLTIIKFIPSSPAIQNLPGQLGLFSDVNTPAQEALQHSKTEKINMYSNSQEQIGS